MCLRPPCLGGDGLTRSKTDAALAANAGLSPIVQCVITCRKRRRQCRQGVGQLTRRVACPQQTWAVVASSDYSGVVAKPWSSLARSPSLCPSPCHFTTSHPVSFRSLCPSHSRLPVQNQRETSPVLFGFGHESTRILPVSFANGLPALLRPMQPDD